MRVDQLDSTHNAHVSDEKGWLGDKHRLCSLQNGSAAEPQTTAALACKSISIWPQMEASAQTCAKTFCFSTLNYATLRLSAELKWAGRL